MKILITGGNGYIARNMEVKLKEFNHVIYSPSRSQMNILDISSIHKNLDQFQPDAIIHAASVGGHRNTIDNHSVFVENFTMFENILQTCKSLPIIFYTSGADCDRRFPIDTINESDVIYKYPIDPYGLSKNLIVRKILNENITNVKILRIFATFNYDEIDTRFIKNSILRVKGKLPIIIHKNRQMDFFFMDDLVKVTNHVLSNTSEQIHLNMSYSKKFTLKDISNIICQLTNTNSDLIQITSTDTDNPYSGSGQLLNNTNIKFIGLETGIYNTVHALLK